MGNAPYRLLELAWYRLLHGRSLATRLAAITLKPGPALVLGSAPQAVLPVGFDDTWSVVTANAAQVRAEQWGILSPTLTVFRSGMAEQEQHQDEVWAQLRQRQTGHLVATGDATSRAPLLSRMMEYEYRSAHLHLVTKLERVEIIVQASGSLTPALGKSVSQGIFAAALALRLGAPCVVLAGISFSSTDHFYGSWGKRGHLDADRNFLALARRKAMPIFASDPAFARESGLPPWTGESALARRPLRSET